MEYAKMIIQLTPVGIESKELVLEMKKSKAAYTIKAIIRKFTVFFKTTFLITALRNRQINVNSMIVYIRKDKNSLLEREVKI